MTKPLRPTLPAIAAVLALANLAFAQATAQTESATVKKPDVVFWPTPQVVVDKMLELAEVTPKDIVYDLGCGDGRIVVSAARRGAHAIGFDVDPERIRETQQNIARNNVEEKAKVIQKDIFTQDLSSASVVTLYLLPRLNVKLIPQLEKLKPGSRIVSHDFDMVGVKPEKVVKLQADGMEHRVFLWRTPLQKEKTAQKP